MATLTDIRYINNNKGEPEYALVPYKLFKSLAKDQLKIPAKSITIPHEVVGKITIEGLSPIKAWREYLKLTQKQVAESLNISQAAYSQMESAKKVRKATAFKIAQVFGIDPLQLRL